jgi:hypothetical protein
MGWMDDHHYTRFQAIPLKSNTYHSNKKTESVVPKAKFACPASQNAILAMIRREGQETRSTDGVFDPEPVVQIDANFYTSRVQDRLIRLGLTYDDFENKPHPNRRIYHAQLRDYYGEEADEMPLYPSKYLDMKKIVEDFRELLNPAVPMTKEEFVSKIRAMPRVSPNIDQAKQDILGCDIKAHDINQLRGRLASVVSLKEHSLASAHMLAG